MRAPSGGASFSNQTRISVSVFTNFRSYSAAFTGGLAAVSLVAAVGASAQVDEDLDTLVTNGFTAMNAGKWEEALALHQQAVDRYGRNEPLKLFGPRFGMRLQCKRRGMSCPRKTACFSNGWQRRL